MSQPKMVCTAFCLCLVDPQPQRVPCTPSGVCGSGRTMHTRRSRGYVHGRVILGRCNTRHGAFRSTRVREAPTSVARLDAAGVQSENNPRELLDVPHILNLRKLNVRRYEGHHSELKASAFLRCKSRCKIASDWFNETKKEILLQATRRGDVCWWR
jgi:hypothetical protein